MNFYKFQFNKGVTLIELIMVIVVVGVLAGGLSFGINEVIEVWGFLTFHNEIALQGRMALMRMGREIRQIGDSDSIYTCLPSEIDFNDINENRINFRFSGNTLLRNGDILADNVSGLIFTYYDEDGSTADSCPDTYRIAIELQLSRGTQTLTLRSQIYPRNL
jgi:prepilin-type N-terminal cleavage/methylation domain-containing protein